MSAESSAHDDVRAAPQQQVDVSADPFSSPVVGTSGCTSGGLGWVDPPSSLTLQQVHYLVRHGERTPVRTRLQNAKPPVPTRWMLCHAGKDFRAAILDVQALDRSGSVDGDTLAGPSRSTTRSFVPGLTDEVVEATDYRQYKHRGTKGEMKIRRRVEATDARGERILPTQPGECLLGELTDLGRASTHNVGRQLRSLYVDKLKLTPPVLHDRDEGKVYFRSTNMSRTVESLQGIISALYPQTKSGGNGAHDGYTPSVLVRNGVSENLLPNTFGCARLRDLDRHFAAAAAALHNPRLQKLDDVIKPHNDGKPPRVDGHPRLNGILDTVRASKVHNIPIPSVFEQPGVIDAVETAVCDEWYSGYKAEDPATRQQFRRLAMGRFLGEVSERLNAKAAYPASTPLALAVYSAHDTSIAGVLSTLEVFNNRWPAFTATLGLELFKQQDNSIMTKLGLRREAHYVRVRYGDKTLKLPACEAAGKHLSQHPEFCTLEAFTETVSSLRHPNGTSWEEECDQRG